jgi:hypothetical protein
MATALRTMTANQFEMRCANLGETASRQRRRLYRYALEVCDVGQGRGGVTVRVNDGKPGDELQLDFGRLGLIPNPGSGRQRVCQALIFTPVVSRYTFVWRSFRQGVEDVIAGCEAA